MAIKTYTVTLRDGQTESRKSARRYTHVVVCVYTDAYLADVLGRLELELDGFRATIAAHAAAAATDEDKAAYAAASERFAYLHALVPVSDGSGETTRWLTVENGYAEGTEAHHAIRETAQGKINRAQADLELAQERRERTIDRIVPGRCYVEGWSMSGANAMKVAAKADRLCHVYMTDEIAVREHAPRAKKAEVL